MDILLLLPAELTLQIFSHLYVDDLLNLRLVSHSWETFFDLHESTIYHHASALHNLIPSHQTLLSDLNLKYTDRSLEGVKGWKTFFQRRLQIGKNWAGKGPSKLVELASTGKTVHRLKVDENAGLVITTHIDGGLLVTDLWQDRKLWSLPTNYVREYAHVEYDNGYIIFDRYYGAKEVWRTARDYDPDNVPQASPPDARQVDASILADLTHSYESIHGHFKPWALLLPPEQTRAYRFVYPTLLVSSYQSLYLWDIPTSRIIQIITNIQVRDDGLGTLGRINYVELNDLYVFVCGSTQLRVFSRADGKLLLYINSTESDIQSRFWSMRLELSEFHTLKHGAALRPQPAKFFEREIRDGQPRAHEFIAVHISSCGRHLCALRSAGAMLVVRDFEKVIRGEISLSAASLSVHFGSATAEAKYLAVSGRRAAAAMETGVFIFDLDPDFPATHTEDSDNVTNAIYPHINASRALQLHDDNRLDDNRLDDLSCLQMTDTAVYLTWNSNNAFSESTVYYIDVCAGEQNGQPMSGDEALLNCV